MSIASEILAKYENKNESKTRDSIKALIDTNFSSSPEEKGKAAELLKGLFYSKDSEAVEFIKELDKLIGDMEYDKEDVDEQEDVDFEKADLLSLWSVISSKIKRKAPAKQAELFEDLLLKVLAQFKEMPSGETKLRTLFKEFKSKGMKEELVDEKALPQAPESEKKKYASIRSKIDQLENQREQISAKWKAESDADKRGALYDQMTKTSEERKKLEDDLRAMRNKFRGLR